ncbi:hypothetical protein JRQ81_012697 [Phrynocephalus forsythii]|uniref:Uncharacterized protein n=1 Tax=Phrynocephalus forsythii TaxID=171643 RepID=A0A9Q1B662_9SAUR|nr:hypothetical protein JRQ81_012697 [Phrynocephalus forsythii]
MRAGSAHAHSGRTRGSGHVQKQNGYMLKQGNFSDDTCSMCQELQRQQKAAAAAAASACARWISLASERQAVAAAAAAAATTTAAAAAAAAAASSREQFGLCAPLLLCPAFQWVHGDLTECALPHRHTSQNHHMSENSAISGFWIPERVMFVSEYENERKIIPAKLSSEHQALMA